MREKIVIVTNSLSLGGAERISLMLAEWMKVKNIDITLVTLKKDREKGYDANIDIKRVAINKETESISLIGTIRKLREFLKSYKPSHILVMGVPLGIYVVPAALGLRVSVIISERNDPLNFAGKRLTKFISRKLMYLADGFVFQTKEALSFYPKVIQNKAKVIPNPLNLENLPEPYEGKRQKKIVSVGRLVPQKNHKLLIQAFNKVVSDYPNYTLNIYGNGSEREKLEQFIDELNLSDKVFLPGAKRDVFQFIKDASVFVLSSDFEGMPNALIEAMALGLPVVSTDCSGGGAKSLIKDQYNGLLVPVGDLDEMVKAIILLIKDDNLSEKVSINAKDIRKKLEINEVGNKWLDFIRGV
ncbi:glycosyltransferase family 4 protein [Ornithinibacillus halotolerans]|uniref:Glycosyl transferase n=1 Tax=Ornithinibacillus halotolerans TaxID=1274357 RepID=A0A916RQT9_9BACI|nr:glycosyltransferase family 4 protein [Ornithinibacillus halotolerans]GGA65140.1 glycosyl transferase [Ornithinibacillus halotolerans]